jgi:hypothetical protein
MISSVSVQRRRSSIYCSRVACGYCHSAKSWVSANQTDGAISESLGDDSPGDLSNLSCGVLKSKDRMTFRM